MPAALHPLLLASPEALLTIRATFLSDYRRLGDTPTEALRAFSVMFPAAHALLNAARL